MHLRKLKIQDFRAIRSLSISFEDALGRLRPVTVIAGPNGCGKTSLLFAIVQALRGALHARIPDVPLPSDDDLHRAEPTGRRPVIAKVELELQYDESELAAIRNVFDSTQVLRDRESKPPLRPPELTNGRLKLLWQYPPRLLRDGTRASVSELQSEPDYGAVWLNGPSAAWRGWKNRLLQSMTETYRVGVLSVFPQDRDRHWGLDLDDTDETQAAEIPTVAQALRRLGEWAHGQGLEADDDRRQWESQLQDRFRRICGPKEYKGYWIDHARYGETPLLEDNGMEYPFRAAASGELVILHYLTKFAFPRPMNNSLVLIDEPELHLHPRWIRQLYRALPLMGENNQFLLVTHSADLRQFAAEDNALIDLGFLGDGSGSSAGA